MEISYQHKESFFLFVSKRFSFYFIALLSLASLLIFVVLLTSEKNDTYEYIPLLPFISFLVFFIVSFSVKNHHNKDKGGSILGCLILFMYFIRNVISPYIFVNNNCESVFKNFSKSQFNQAIIIMIYEFIIVSFVVLYFIKKTRTETIYINSKKRRVRLLRSSQNKYFGLCILCLFICIICLVFSAELRATYFSIFTSNFNDVDMVSIDSKSQGFYRIIYTGGKLLLNSFRFIFPVTIITLIARKKTFLRVHICLIIAFCQVFFMTDGNAYILILMIIQLMYISKMFPDFSRLIIIYILIAFVFVIVLVFVNRFSHTYYANSQSSFIQSYFSGVSNYASGVNMINNNNENKLALLFEDFYSCIPFRNTIFGYLGTGYRLADYYNDFSFTRAQIIPMGVESSYYFSYLLSPLLPTISIALSFGRLRKVIDPNNSGIEYAVNLLVVVVLAISPVMYDARILFQLFIQYFTIMFLFSFLSHNVESLKKPYEGKL